MKKSLYLFLILAVPAIATAQTTKKKTTTTKTTTTVKKTTAPVKKTAAPAAQVASHIEFQTFVMGNDIMLNGDFQVGKDYVVAIKDDQKITLFTANFNAQSNAQNVSLGKPLPKGSYTVTVHEKDNALATGTINLVLN
ncbi:hypothetical protein [Polluticoccus soli]|uniref:hypothetical protein n=1 Tax=Polluticoccus soli TaxID=3034150 RepID=UPI0023E156B8|nr:hypothetical protein [Flavipsychrobacter sp. JY13-12]